MRSGSRRAVILLTGAVVSAGCVGPELTTDDTPPPDVGTDDSAELDATQLDAIESLVTDINDTLSTAADVFEDWYDEPAESELDPFDDLRRRATSQLDAIRTTVRPYEDELQELAPGATIDGEEPSIDGSELVSAINWQRTLLLAIEDATIGILDADGNPAAVSQGNHDAADRVITESESAQSAVTAALSGESAG